MQKHSDEALVAYLDGELDIAERRACRSLARRRSGSARPVGGAGAVRRSGAQRLCRHRQRAAARAADRGGARRDWPSASSEAEILVLRPRRAAGADAPSRRWLSALRRRRGCSALMFGGAGTYVGDWAAAARPWRSRSCFAAAAAQQSGSTTRPATTSWRSMPAKHAGRCPGQQRYARGIAEDQPEPAAGAVADLKPWGSEFPRRPAGGCRGTAGGAARLYHRQQGDRSADAGHRRVEAARLAPTIDKRQDVNLLYWRHQGRAYALSGRPTSAISGASPTISPGNCGRFRLSVPRSANPASPADPARRR